MQLTEGLQTLRMEEGLVFGRVGGIKKDPKLGNESLGRWAVGLELDQEC